MKLAPPFPSAKGFGLSRHKETLPRTLVFTRHQMAPVSRLSAAGSRFSCREGETQPAVTAGFFSGLLRQLTHPCAEQVARDDMRTREESRALIAAEGKSSARSRLQSGFFDGVTLLRGREWNDGFPGHATA